VNARTALVPALVAVLLTGCAAGQEQEGAASAPVASTPSAGPSPTQAPTAAPTAVASATPAPAVRTVAVAYAGGEVTGTTGREEVPVGEQVVLRISSDVAEEVHVHGYDLEGAVPAGGSVDIPLTASIPGVFEVELHDAGKVLFQLRVA
jgi:hypothetical protein